MEIIEKQEIVKFHNDLNKIKFNEFNLYDYKIFFVACVKVLEKGDNLIEIDFSELRKILELTKRNTVSTEYLENMILETANKLAKINFNIENRFFKGFSTLFTDFYIPKEGEKKLYVRINEKTKYILNNLVRNFTLANLQLLNSLTSKYSYRLYLELKQFENIDDKNKFEKDGRFYCWRNFEIENFREIMDIPESYKMNDIDKRVLKPSLKELQIYFEDIFITKVKKLRKVTNIIFYFIFKKDDFTLAVNKNISPLEEYFNLTFVTVKYTNAIKNKLEELLEKNSLAYVKKYLEDNWSFISNNKSIKDKAAYFSQLITTGASVITSERKEKLDQIEKKKEVKKPLKDGIYTVSEFLGEEEKEEFKNILPNWDSVEKKENTNTITSLRDLQNSYFEEIPEDQKIEVTQEEYNELLNKFIEEKRKIVASSGRKIDIDVLKSIFKIKEAKKYKIVTEKTTENTNKFEINIKNFSAKELTKLENYLKQYRIKLKDINSITDKKIIQELKNFIKKELKEEEKFENYDVEIERSINNESSRYQYLYDETTVNELFNGKKLNEKGQEFWEKMIDYFDGEEFFEEELTGVNGKPLTGGKKEFIKAKLVREYAVNYKFDF